MMCSYRFKNLFSGGASVFILCLFISLLSAQFTDNDGASKFAASAGNNTNKADNKEDRFDIEACLIHIGSRNEDAIINLGPLTRRDGYPRFNGSKTIPMSIPDIGIVEVTYNYSFNPCLPFSLPKASNEQCFADGCHHAIICKSEHQNNRCHYATLGDHAQGHVEVKVGLKPNNQTTVALVYTGLGSQRQVKTVVKLTCDPTRTQVDQALFEVITDNGMDYVIMEVSHACCCVGGCWDAEHGASKGGVNENSEKVLVLVGAFIGLIIVVLLIAVMCYVKKTHAQFYSKLPGVSPNSASKDLARRNSLTVRVKDSDMRDYEPVGPNSGRFKVLPILDICVIPFKTVEMKQRLGGNPFGDTHLGRWKEMTLTIKRLTLSIHDNQLTPDIIAWMKQEVTLISRQRHKNIVSVLGICVDGRFPCLLSEYVLGECLKDYLKCSGHRLSWPQKVRMCQQVSEGMHFLHSTKPAIIHRDLRCGNIFLCDNNLVKVADFSLTKLVQPLREQCDADDCSCQRLMSGCPSSIRWTAPELLSNPRVKEGEGETISTACDVYSFGLVMWEMVVFHDPFYKIASEDEVIEIVKNGGRPDITKGPEMMTQYRDLMKQCWDQQPKLRPSCKQVAHKLKDLVGAARSHQKHINSQNLHKVVEASSPV